MSSINTILAEKLARLIGTARCPAIVDVRTDDDFAADPRLIPGSVRRSHGRRRDWASGYIRQPSVVVCQQGRKLSQGVAAWLRHAGGPAESLAGGFEGWAAASLPLDT